MFLLNAFSLNMISNFPFDIHGEEISLEQAKTLAVDATSAVGHADTANVFGSVLGVNVPTNRATVYTSPQNSDNLLRYKIWGISNALIHPALRPKLLWI